MRALLFAAAVSLAVGCGPAAPPAIDGFFPADSAVGSWVKDPASPTVQVAKTNTAIEALINGDAAPFIAKGTVAFAWGKYQSGAYRIDARVWQMKSTANATETFAYLLTDAPLYKANTWTDVTIGEAGRIADTGSTWWVNARKGSYILEVKASAKDATTRADAEAFAKAMAQLMP